MKKIGKLFIALGIIAVFASCIKVTDEIAELTKIEITSQSDKVEFFAGDELDTTALEVTAFYSDGSKSKVENWTVTGYDSSVIGEQTITVSYTEDDVTKTTSYKITVKALTLDKIEITAQAEKTEYYVGDVFDTTGLVVTATYNSGKTEDVTAKAEITGFDSTAAAASQKITVTYEGKTAEFTVKITAVTVAKLEITAQPTITEYYIGDTLDTTGLVVTATYNSGKTEDVTAKAEITGFDSRYATEKLTVTAAYGGKTATFTVKILSIELASIKITKEPAKKVYYLKDSFDATGLEVTAYYNNGTNKVLKENEYATNFNSSTAAESKTVEVTYHGQKAQFTVKIIGEKEIKITKDATNTTVYQYQPVNATGLEISMVYEDGTEKVLTPSNYTLTCDTTKTGNNTVTVSYGEKTVSYAVTMIAVDSISVTTPPTKTNYYWDTDTALDTTGLVITEKFTDNTTKPLTVADYSLTGFDITNKQQQPITVTYKNKTTSFNVTVHDSTIEVTTPPTKTKYYIGDSINLAGAVVTETYDDGKTRTINNSDLAVTGFDTTILEEDQTVTLTYNGKTAEFTVDVVFNWYETPEQLPAGTNGTYGTEGTYVYFGVWPQDVVSEADVEGLNLNEEATTTIVRGYLKYVRGTNGYYVKCNENRYSSSYTYTKDGSAVGTGSRWFKVMPIKWRVVDTEYDVDGTNGNNTAKLLVAENILTANVPYYESTSSRTISISKVYANKYMHSQIRAYLNGLSYQGQSAEQTKWNNKGFLQTAFTSDAINKIMTTEVNNSGESTTDVGKHLYWANGKQADGVTDSGHIDYTCENTKDKIFLLSEYEVTKYSKTTEIYYSSGQGNSRIRVTTDFAKANNAYQTTTNGYGGYWWLRTPMCNDDNHARYVGSFGDANSDSSVDRTSNGVVPALSISF